MITTLIFLIFAQNVITCKNITVFFTDNFISAIIAFINLRQVPPGNQIGIVVGFLNICQWLFGAMIPLIQVTCACCDVVPVIHTVCTGCQGHC